MKPITTLTNREKEGVIRNYSSMSVKTKRRYEHIILTISIKFERGKLGLDLKTADMTFLIKSQGIAAAIRANVGGYYDPQFIELDALDEANEFFFKAIKKVSIEKDGAVSAKNTQKERVKIILDNALDFVNRLAKLNPKHSAEIITSAKMLLVKKRSGGKHGLKVKQGRGTGVIDLSSTGKKINGKYVRCTYFWEYSIDDKKTWIPLGSNMKASYTARNMKVGVKTFFRMRNNTHKEGTSDWVVAKHIFPE